MPHMTWPPAQLCQGSLRHRLDVSADGELTSYPNVSLRERRVLEGGWVGWLPPNTFCVYLPLLLAALRRPRLGSVVAVWRLSCSQACGILVPRPGIEPMSPALEADS